MEKCYKCGKELKNSKYLMHTIDLIGSKVFVYVCSEKCGNEVANENSMLHFQRYEDVKNQTFQKIKI